MELTKTHFSVHPDGTCTLSRLGTVIFDRQPLASALIGGKLYPASASEITRDLVRLRFGEYAAEISVARGESYCKLTVTEADPEIRYFMPAE